MSKIIAIVSAKGGVGKTTTAINLGTALAGFGRPTILVDGNLSTPNIGLHLGSPIVPSSVHDAVLGRKNIKNCVYTHQSGLRVAPASISMDDFRKADKSKLSSVVKELDGDCEIIVVDSSSGLDDSSVLDVADEAVVVSTPDMPAVTDALKTVHLAEEKGVTVVGVVLNKVSGDEHEITSDVIEGIIEKPVIASIPEDKKIKSALNKNHPVVYIHPDSDSSIAYKELAALLLGQEYKVLTKKGG